MRRSSPYSIAPATKYDALLASFGPQVWWKLADASGSSTAADSSGNGHTGTATSVTFGITGPVAGDKAASFDGASKITSSYKPSAWKGITAIAWYDYHGTYPATANPRLVANSHADGSTTHYGFELYMNSDSGTTARGVFFCVANGTTTANAHKKGVNSDVGWHMLAGTYDGTTVRVFHDGVEQATAALTGDVAASTTAIGAGFGVSYTGDYLTGYEAQVAVFDYALAPSAISRLYAAHAVTAATSGAVNPGGSGSYHLDVLVA